jgi:hypothetical protein
MTVFQGFVLGLMASWIPGLIFLGCIALGSAPEDRRHQQSLQSDPRHLNA